MYACAYRPIVKLHLAVSFVLVIIAVGSLSLGCMLISQSSYRSVDHNYHVSISAPDDVTWTLYLPKPLKEMSVLTTGSKISVSDIQTPYGLMHNVTGRGKAGIDQADHESVYAPESEGTFFAENLDLSGWDASGLWIWRQSSSAGAVVHVNGGAWWVATSLGEKTSCGGPGYSDDVLEGWNVATLIAGDCTSIAETPIRTGTTTALLFASFVTAITAVAVTLIWGVRPGRTASMDDS